MPSNITTKMLGDAGEHYALSQFTFAGKPASKMPDGWSDYDLAVETGHGLARVSVKTRSERAGWSAARWFMFDEQKDCDWLVFIFKPDSGVVRSWVVPFAAAKEHGNRPTAIRKDPHTRYVYWTRLNNGPLAPYENNWELRP
jgi:hypothetical protein